MKKLLLSIIALLAVGVSSAQVLNTNTTPPTLTGPGIDAINLLSTATNWIVAPFIEYTPQAAAKSQYGGGIAAVVNLNESRTVATMIRGDYVGSSWWMPSASLQLQLPINISTNATLTFFGFSGAAVPLGGKNQNDIAGIFGSGIDLKLNRLSSHWSMAFDVEYWSNMDGVQYRFSPLVWRF